MTMTSACHPAEPRPPLPRWQEVVLTYGGVFMVIFLPIMLLVLAPLEQTNAQLPFALALGCKLIIGWLFGRSVDFFFGLPPLLGYMAFGFITRDSQGHMLIAARTSLLTLAFIVVLLRAGLEISPKDLNAFSMAIACLPFAADALGSGLTASALYDLNPLEGATYVAIMSSLGEGIVIPRMVDMIRRAAPGHTVLPRAVLTAAPLECILALFMYGTCASMLDAMPRKGEPVTVEPISDGMQAGVVLLTILCTLLMATAIAHSFALLLGSRKKLIWSGSGKRFFIGSTHEELIVVISMAIIAYGVSYVTPVPYSLQPKPIAGHAAEHHRRLAEGGGHVQSLVEADLCVVATVFIFAQLRPKHTVHRVEEGIAGIWTVGAIFLFTALGASLRVPAGLNPLILLAPVAVGVCCRMGMMTLIMAATARSRGISLNARNLFFEVAFMMAATLPRATIQGVLGGLPLANNVVSKELGGLYASTAALTVVFFAPLGTIIQTFLCERCLSRTDVAPQHAQGQHVAVAVNARASEAPTAPGATIVGAISSLWKPNKMTTADADVADPSQIVFRSEEREGMDAPSAGFKALPSKRHTPPPSVSASHSHDHHAHLPKLREEGGHDGGDDAPADERKGEGTHGRNAAEPAGEGAHDETLLPHAPGRAHSTISGHATEPLSAEEDAELSRIAGLYSHAPVLPNVPALSRQHSSSAIDDHHATDDDASQRRPAAAHRNISRRDTHDSFDAGNR